MSYRRINSFAQCSDTKSSRIDWIIVVIVLTETHHRGTMVARARGKTTIKSCLPILQLHRQPQPYQRWAHA